MKKILIVNDCRFESLIMKDNLSDIGYSVEVTDEYSVFIQIKMFEPEIVIANLIMKNTTGDKIISHVKKTHPETICLLSSCDLIKLEDFDKSNVDEVIHTPINKSRLSEVLDKTLSKCSTKEFVEKDVHKIFERLNSKRNTDYRSTNSTVLDKKDNNPEANMFSFCPYCGNRIGEKDQSFLFCPYCGQGLKN